LFHPFNDTNPKMKPNKPVWLAAALALVVAGSWLLVREAPPQAPSVQESRDAAAADQGGRMPEPAAVSVRQAPISPKPTVPDRATGQPIIRKVAAGRSTPAPTASPPLDETGSANNRGPDRSRGTMGSVAAGEDPETLPTPATPPPAGLKLAPDVRLPAAALPVDFKMTPVAEQALKNIIDDYYQDLAAALAPELEATTNGQDNGGAGTLIETGENGEKTMVVTNGKIAENARKRADARFRALFGNAHFNRMTIQSALESRLPVDGGN
jgi:hypothetical protein